MLIILNEFIEDDFNYIFEPSRNHEDLTEQVNKNINDRQLMKLLHKTYPSLPDFLKEQA